MSGDFEAAIARRRDPRARRHGLFGPRERRVAIESRMTSPGGIALLGGGNMGRALIGGLLRRGHAPGADQRRRELAAAREARWRATSASAPAADNARGDRGRQRRACWRSSRRTPRAVLAPLPPRCASAAPAAHLGRAPASASRHSSSWCGRRVPVVRAMPNRPALVGAGVTGLYAPARRRPQRSAPRRRAVMQAVGEVVWVHHEDALDVGHRALRQRPGVFLPAGRAA